MGFPKIAKTEEVTMPNLVFVGVCIYGEVLCFQKNQGSL